MEGGGLRRGLHIDDDYSPEKYEVRGPNDKKGRIEKDLDFLLFGEKKPSKIKVEEKKLSPKHNISQEKTKVE